MIDLPVKLVVIFLILSLSVPLLMEALERNEETNAMNAMEHEFTKFSDVVSIVHYSGTGSMRTITVNVPDGCEIHIGGEGENSYSIRGTYNGTTIKRYMEVPPIRLLCDLRLDPGEHVLTVRSVTEGGRSAAEVSIR